MGNDFVERFRLSAEEYLKERRVREIDFSHSTYQIEVKDKESEESVFSFLQFDEEEMLSDAFCSCDIPDTCPHLAASFLRIYNGEREPLHIRFQHSFWNALALIFADHFSYKPLLRAEKEGLSFQIKGKSKEATQKLNRLTKKREAATPENSIKFSGLPPEEITRWREGRASPLLRYELSFWADFAKWLMVMQEDGKKIKVTFECDENGFPTLIHLESVDLVADFQITPEHLGTLIPTLETVDSSLQVHKRTTEGLNLTYDEKKRTLTVQRPEKVPLPLGGHLVGEWIFVANDGFYPLDSKSELTKSEFKAHEIEEALNTHGELIAKYLTNAKVNKKAVPLSYHMWFDENWNLHMSAFVFSEGDLKEESNALFGKWAYISSKGFFPLTHVLFDTPEMTLKSNEVPNFIARTRHLLAHVKGFGFHLANMETALTYTVSEEGVLNFVSKQPQESARIKEFGEWIYIEGEGFFARKTAISLAPGISVEPPQVSHFIKMNIDELEHIPKFFFGVNPLASRGVALTMTPAGEIQILPEYELKEAYTGFSVIFYDEYLYLTGRGFAELPHQFRLPKRFEKPLTIKKEELSHFFDVEFAKLHPFITSIDPKIVAPHRVDLQVATLSRGVSGLDASLFYETEIGKISVLDIHEAFANKQRYLFSSGGRLDLFDERFKWIAKLKTNFEKKEVTLSSVDFLRLDLEQSVLLSESVQEEGRKAIESLRTFTTPDEPVISGLQSELRLYQRTGLDWLWFLYRNDLSGLLCDDMGLGKTHQAMALLAAVHNFSKGARFLVVAPTSVIYHWQEKLEKFLPHFKVHLFHGLKRGLKRLPKEGIILTSYGIVRTEQEKLSKLHFDVAVFDELQVAKNPSSRTHGALLHLKAKMRIGLSGTPIENNLRELKSLFDIVLPGYMPKESDFRDHFILPIEREGSSERRALLGKLIKPFVLRRKKKEVLQELPEKTEDKSYCDLSEEQQQLYQETLEKHRTSLITPLQQGEGAIPFVHIFSVLASLKQICDHPALIKKDPANYKNYASGKWDLFTELISEAIESEQKVVVFTQYLTMLDIMQNYLREMGVSYAEIRGDTIDRQEQMQKFQNDPRCLVFIGTLQAAGLGIDLTAASIVILYDRWWNAARENQAIDRVHRIGQKWGVQVYKLITKGTIEEKIDLLITRKGRLLEEVVLADDEAQIKRFTREELLDLLSYRPLSK